MLQGCNKAYIRYQPRSFAEGMVMDESLEKARRVQQQCLDQARRGVAQGSGVDPADSFTEALFAAEARGELDAFFDQLKARQAAQASAEPSGRS